MITKEQYEENQRIIDGAPDGATHYGGYENDTGCIKVSEGEYREWKCGAWVSEFAECRDFEIDRSLEDIRTINAQYRLEQVLKSALCAVIVWRELSNHGEFPIERIEMICRDAINQPLQEGE